MLSWKPLNWMELGLLAPLLEKECAERKISRFSVPECPFLPEGYLKNEWAIELSENRCLILSLRPHWPYLYITKKKLKIAQSATLSPFGLLLKKNLIGKKLLELKALPKDRTVILWFSGEPRLGLVLTLIPTAPYALLIQEPFIHEKGWAVLEDSRSHNKNLFYQPSQNLKAPLELEARSDLVSSLPSFQAYVQKSLFEETLSSREKILDKQLREKIQKEETLLKKLQTSLEHTEKEPCWQKHGEMYKLFLSDPTYKLSPNFPLDPKLNKKEQLEKFFTLEKKKQKKIKETKEKINSIEQNLKKPQNPTEETVPQKKEPLHPGRSFISLEGYPIWIGKNQKENLELTFRLAKGNDLWLHLRGRPSAHAIIHLPKNKSPSLETLLDAANLLVFYTLGRTPEKIEVDYTFKKYVKRLKNSEKVTYTHNKSLLVTLEPTRLERLVSFIK